MVEHNDLVEKDKQARSRRRKSTAWKSGLMLTGLGGVVLGAGYLAGVNAPAVARSSTPQAVAQTAAGSPTRQDSDSRQQSAPSAERTTDEENRTTAPQNNDDGQPGLFMGYDENGNAVYLTNDGSLVIGGSDNSGSNSLFNQQFGGQSSRRSRSLTQQPNFSRPMTRSRGS